MYFKLSIKINRSSVTRNCNNLIRIQALTSQENENEAGTTEKYFVPSVLLSNTMSLTPKIDEVAFVMKQNHCDIAAITETWLLLLLFKNILKR